MELKIPLVLNYKPLNISKEHDNIESVIDRDDNENIYITIANGKMIFKTFVVNVDGSIKIYNDKPLELNEYQLTPELTVHVKDKDLYIMNEETIMDTFKNTHIVKYVFNPHERTGAIILMDNSILRKKYYLILGFNDNSYTIIEKPSIDVIPYANGFLLAYLEKSSIVIEKTSSYEKRQYDIEATRSLRLIDTNSFLSLTYDKGTLIIDKKDLQIIEKVYTKNTIPLGLTYNGLILWNMETRGIYYKNPNSNESKVILVCENKPTIIGFLKGKTLLRCKNSIIELGNNNWRLHESSAKLIGKNIVATAIVGENLVVGTRDRVYVWGSEKYYFKPRGLLNLLALRDKKLVIIDRVSLGIVDISRQIDPKEIITYSDTSIDGNLRLRKRLIFNDKIIVSNILVQDNKVVIKKKNTFDLIIVRDNPVIFDVLYYGGYKVQHSQEYISYDFKVLSAYSINYYLDGKVIKRFLIIRYSYVNPLNRNIIKKIYSENKSIGLIKLARRSKGVSTIILQYDPDKTLSKIKIDEVLIPIKSINVTLQRLLINEILLKETNNGIILSLKIASNSSTKSASIGDLYVCVKGFFNGCKRFNITDMVNGNRLVQILTTIDPRRENAIIILYSGLNYQYMHDLVVLDEIKIPVEINMISLLPILCKNRLYIVIDDIPFDNEDLLLLTDRIENIYVDKIPYVIKYEGRDLKSIKNISLLKLYNDTIYYSSSNVKAC